MRAHALRSCVSLFLLACGTSHVTDAATPFDGGGSIDAMTDAAAVADAAATDASARACDGAGRSCEGDVLRTCDAAGATPVELECPLACDPSLGCVTCVPGAAGCEGGSATRCADDGSGAAVVDECDLDAGEGCREGACVDLCADAAARGTHEGCTFWAVDLDNAALGAGADASRLDFGIVVANPWTQTVRVTVEQNDALPGDPPELSEVLSVDVLARDHEVIVLPRREVDGSSESGSNDGTHTALTSHAYRVHATLPVVVQQLNPIESDAFSAEASLLAPEASLGGDYTVVGWPATIADSDDPNLDFDPSVDDEDLRAFLTIVGTTAATHVTITLGALEALGGSEARVVAGGPVSAPLGPGSVLDVDLGAFDVLNLETEGFGADFTGTVIAASAPVAVFVGSEASDVPTFTTLSNRSCCGDHLEEQLAPDGAAGQRFVIGRQPSREAAIARAREMSALGVNEPEWVRVVAAGGPATLIGDHPDLPLSLAEGEDVTLQVDESFELRVAAPGRVHVMSALASQRALGLTATGIPGGDPSLLGVPPVAHFARVAELLVPASYAFDFVTIVAPVDARVELDGTPLAELLAPDDSDACQSEPAGAAWTVHQCQVSFPVVGGDPIAVTDDGVQGDGGHVVSADQPVGVSVSGFHAYIGYATSAGFDRP